MGSFKELEKKKALFNETNLSPQEPQVVVANDNGVDSNPAVESFSEALKSFVNRKQVEQICLQTLSDNSCNRFVNIYHPTGVQETLPDEARHYLFPEILQTVQLNLPAALIGPAGSGKSTVVQQIADTMHLRYILQNGVTGTHELTGYMDAHGRYNTTPFRDAFENGGLVLVDEVDTSDPGSLKWLNTALANGHAAFPDRAEPISRHKDFRIIIAANTWGTGADRVYVGANQLDASTLDRFVFFNFRYDEKLERLLCGNAKWTERVQQLRKNADTVHARIVISPRASINGAKLLAAGWDQKKVEESVIWKGIDPEMKERILNPKQEKKAA